MNEILRKKVNRQIEKLQPKIPLAPLAPSLPLSPEEILEYPGVSKAALRLVLACQLV